MLRIGGVHAWLLDATSLQDTLANVKQMEAIIKRPDKVHFARLHALMVHFQEYI